MTEAPHEQCVASWNGRWGYRCTCGMRDGGFTTQQKALAAAYTHNRRTHHQNTVATVVDHPGGADRAVELWLTAAQQ